MVELLGKVGLGPQFGEMYPHELSGGMKQRVTIAIAISMGPQVIVADEPTSALDVVVQRQIMETLAELQDELGAAILLIGHDIGLMAQFVDTLGVMYAGKLVETGTLRQLLREPKHRTLKCLSTASRRSSARTANAAIFAVSLGRHHPYTRSPADVHSTQDVRSRWTFVRRMSRCSSS